MDGPVGRRWFQIQAWADITKGSNLLGIQFGLKVVAVPFAQIGPISVHFPERVETNEQLQAEFPDWDLGLIAEKTGIHQRYIAGPQETASDLAVAAAEKLFAEQDVDPKSIDFILLCTQTPDYPLPTTACLIQHRLGLRESCGALDFNLGCSGFVYGLAVAEGLIRCGAARNILLLTAETYSKYIDADDRSLRTIFGDAAAATLVRGERHGESAGIPVWHRRKRGRHVAGRRRRCQGGSSRARRWAAETASSQAVEEQTLHGRA